MLAEFAGSLPSGIWQKSAFWSDGEAVHREVTNWKRSATKPPKMGAGEATGHLMLLLSGTGETAYASGARPWRSHPHWRSLVLETPSVLQKPTIGKPLHLGTCPASPTEQRSTALSFCDVSPAPSSDKPKILLDDKGKYLKGPDLFSQSRNERLV